MPDQMTAAPQAQPGQPAGQKAAPFGQTPATQPTPNRGAEAAAMQKLAMATKLVGDALAEAGAASQIGQELLDVLKKLSKMVTPGSSTPASEKNTLDQVAMKNAQQNRQMQMLRQQQMGQGGQGQPQQPAAAA